MSKQTFILCQCHGNNSLMPATMESAMELFENCQKYYIYERLREISKYFADKNASPVAYCSPKTMIDAINDVLSLDIGQPSRSLRFMKYGSAPKNVSFDQRPPVFVQEDWKAEAALWALPHMYARHIQFSSFESVVSHMVLSKNIHPENELSFLKEFKQRVLGDKPVQWCYEEEIEDGRTMYVIENGKWRDGSSELARVRSIVEFVSKYSHRDEKYEIVQTE